MKEILFRLLMAAALTLAAFALSPPAHGQQADEDPRPTSPGPQAKTLVSVDNSGSTCQPFVWQ